MKRHIASTCVGILLSGATALAGGQELSIEYTVNSDLEGLTPYGSQFISLESKTPPGEWKLPEIASERPLYGLAKLGDSEFLIILDASAGGSAGYDRVYLDRNHDRDLSGEAPITGKLLHFDDDAYFFIEFEDSLHLEYEIGEASFPYVLSIQVSGMDKKELDLPDGVELPDEFYDQSMVTLFLTSECCYAGKFERGDRKYRVLLGDGNCDGTFDGQVSIPDHEWSTVDDTLYPEGDHLYLTHKKKMIPADRLLLGDHLLLGEELFTIDVNIREAKLTMSEATEGLLPMKLSHAPDRLVAHSKDFEHSIMMYEPGTEARVPAGEYRLLTYSILGEGKDGDVWRLEAEATGDSPFVSLKGEAGAQLEFGEPFTASADVAEWARDSVPEEGSADKDRRKTSIDFRVRGSAGEEVSGLTLLSGKPKMIMMSREEPRQPLEPSYTIFKPDGEQLKKGSFEYG